MGSKISDIVEKVAGYLPSFKEDPLTAAIVTLTSDKLLTVENHLGIVKYSDSEIRINTRTYMLIIKGTNLYIKNLLEFEIGIMGRIDSLEMVRSE